MYRLRKILPGNYIRKEINGVWYIVGDEKDIRPRPEEFSDNHKSQMIEEFISIDVEDSEEILDFTKSYGPIIAMGLKVFKETAKMQGKSLPADIDETYPFQEAFAFPEYQFKYLHKLVINIWELQNDIAQRRHDEKLFWDFFRLLFQPYGWCDVDNKYLGIQSDMPLAMFTEFYHEMTEGYFTEIGEESVDMFTDVVCFGKSGRGYLIRKLNNEKYSKIEIPDKYKKCLEDDDFSVLTYISEKIWGRGIFDSLERSFEEFENEVNLKDIDDEIFQTIRNLGKVLICDIINDYITSPNLSINENGDFVMEIGDKFLMNIIFDELVVLCQFYETRKCKFRKCHKYFIANKEMKRQKNYCCTECADKEIKYQIREGRRTKRERKPKEESPC